MEKKRIYMSHFTVQQKLNVILKKEPNKTNISCFNSYKKYYEYSYYYPHFTDEKTGAKRVQ